MGIPLDFIHSGKLHLLPLVVFALLQPLPGHAGPPLSIEDPGILEPGQWEVIAAATATSAGSGDFYQFPVADVSLGVLEDFMQVSVVYPYVFAEPKDLENDADFGNAELGVKFKVWDRNALQIAIAPVYSFGITRTLAEIGIGADTDVLFLPVVAEKQISDRFRVNGSVGYASVDGGDDEWNYGAGMGYSLGPRTDFLAELSGAANTQGRGDILDLRAGFDVALADNFHLLFALATGLRDPSDADELHWDAYFAVQWIH